MYALFIAFISGYDSEKIIEIGQDLVELHSSLPRFIDHKV